MPVREVVLDRDIRSPFELSDALLSRYHLRRAASVAALMILDVAAVLLAAVAGPPFWDLLGAHIYRISPLGVAATAAVMIVVFTVQRLYGLRRYRHRVSRIAASWLIVWLIAALLAVLSGTVISGWSLMALWFTAGVVDIVLRRAYDLAVAAVIGEDLDTVRLLFIGPDEACSSIETAMIAADPAVTYRRVGRLDGSQTARLPALFEELWPSEVVIADLDGVGDRFLAVIEACRSRHCALKVAADEQLSQALKGPAPRAALAAVGAGSDHAASAEIDSSASAVCYLPGFAQPVFLVKDTHTRQMHYLVKRVFDVSVAAATLVLLSPVFLVVAIAIKATSRGPVHFVAPRVGVGQQVFDCYKFRTMQADAPARQNDLEELNEADGAIFKISEDPRVTSVGRILRKFSIDELPQLWNVLRGEMSLVGPRPLPLRDVELLQDWHKRRHVVLPGITGLWQVSGRSDVSFDEMIELDFRYIETWSFRRDLAIIGRTLKAVFGSEGAY